MVRVSGREFNGLLNTPCFQHDDPQKQMTCLSCHEMHPPADDARPINEWANDQLIFEMDSNRMGIDNNQACIQCHESYTDTDKLVRHTHHVATSSGSICYNCHMPHTTWGVMKAMRSHTISSPNVAESLAPVGRPNACNLCHLDKTLGWSAEKLHEQYGQPLPKLSEDQKTVAASVLWSLKGNAGQRALAAWGLGWEPARDVAGERWTPPYLGTLLEDPYHVVRFAAHRSLKKLAGFEKIKYDSLGSPAEWSAANRRVLAAWRANMKNGEAKNRASVLIGEAGSLRMNELKRLMGERDSRRVKLLE